MEGKMSGRTIVAAAAVAAAVRVTADPRADDEVTELPELGPLTSKHYSGYFVLNGSDSQNRLEQFENASEKEFHMHYYYTESLGDPAKDPLVLWLNGGPGCSSLLGQWTELGTYMFTQFGHIINNTYSWGQHANMLYLESPVGVGFSYATPNGLYDLDIGDDMTSMLNYQSLRHFLTRFPELRTEGRRLILTGESYAGHYIPQLADRLLELALKAPASDVETDLGKMMRGFAVGNPCTGAPANNPTDDPDADFCYVDPDWTLAEFYRSHGYGIDYLNMSTNWSTDKFTNHLPKYSDPYDILAPTCMNDNVGLHQAVAEKTPHLTADQVRRMSRYLATPLVKAAAALDDAMGAIRPYGPCGGNYMTIYLNRMEVKQALHVKEDIDWSMCSPEGPGTLNYSHIMTNKSNVKGVMHLYRKFWGDADAQANNWTTFIYSGDMDAVVNFVQSQTVVENMAGERIQNMTPWYYRDTFNSSYKQIGGWYIEFEKMQWASVKGCGHMVPGYCPYKGYGLFESILEIGKAGMEPRLFESPVLAPGLIPENECPGYVDDLTEEPIQTEEPPTPTEEPPTPTEEPPTPTDEPPTPTDEPPTPTEEPPTPTEEPPTPTEEPPTPTEEPPTPTEEPPAPTPTSEPAPTDADVPTEEPNAEPAADVISPAMGGAILMGVIILAVAVFAFIKMKDRMCKRSRVEGIDGDTAEAEGDQEMAETEESETSASDPGAPPPEVPIQDMDPNVEDDLNVGAELQ